MVIELHDAINARWIIYKMFRHIRLISQHAKKKKSDFYKHPLLKKSKYDIEKKKWIEKKKDKTK